MKNLKYRIYYADIDATVEVYNRGAFYREIILDMIEHRKDSKITLEEMDVLNGIADRLGKCKVDQTIHYKG